VIIWDLTGSITLKDDLLATLKDFSLTTQDLWPQYEKLCKSRMQQEKSVNLKASFEVSKMDFNSCLIIGSSNIVVAASRYLQILLPPYIPQNLSIIVNVMVLFGFIIAVQSISLPGTRTQRSRLTFPAFASTRIP